MKVVGGPAVARGHTEIYKSRKQEKYETGNKKNRIRILNKKRIYMYPT